MHIKPTGFYLKEESRPPTLFVYLRLHIQASYTY